MSKLSFLMTPGTPFFNGGQATLRSEIIALWKDLHRCIAVKALGADYKLD